VIIIALSGVARASGIELGMPDCSKHHRQQIKIIDVSKITGTSITAQCSGFVCDCDCPLCKYSGYMILMLSFLPDVKTYIVADITVSSPDTAPVLSLDPIPLLRPPNA